MFIEKKVINLYEYINLLMLLILFSIYAKNYLYFINKGFASVVNIINIGA